MPVRHVSLACVSLLLPSVLALVAISGCASTPQAAMSMPPPTQVSVAKIAQMDQSDWDENTGRLEPVESVDIHAHVSGFITRIAFKDGALVKRGDALFDIDAQPYQVQVQKAKAEVAIVHARLAQAQTEAERAKALLAVHGITQELTDQRLSTVAGLAATLQSAEASLAAANLDLEYTHLTAPISGRVSKALLTVGNYVDVGSSTLANLVSVDPVYVTFDMDERTFLAARTLIDAASPENRLPLGIAVEGEAGYPHPAQVSFLDNRIDSQSGTIRIRALLPNPTGQFVVGSFVRIHVPLSKPTPRLLVDERAVGIDQGQHYLFLVDKDHKIVYRHITLGSAFGHLRCVLAGVTADDLVVVNNLQRIWPGATVSPQMVDMVGTPADHAGDVGVQGKP